MTQNIENSENRNKSNAKRDLTSFLQENEKTNSSKTPANQQKNTETKDEDQIKTKRKANKKESLPIDKHLEEEKGNEFIFLAPDNLPPSYLLGVKYDGKIEKAYVKLLNLEDGKVYRWYDNTDHLPYLITTANKNEIENLLKNEKEYIGSEIVKKQNLLSGEELSLTKVIATNPLAIGGRDDSYREKISPSFEANIRYHLNYIYDRNLIPGLYYSIENGGCS